TTYWIEYGTTNAYGQQTAPVDVGSGTSPVTVTPTITGLGSNTTYHYRFVAQNSVGTTYGYDSTALTLGPGAPVNTMMPVINGTPKQGAPLRATNATWTPAAPPYSWQWQRDTGSGPQFISGATGSTYIPGAADVGASISVIVSAHNSSGTASVTTASAGP